MEDMIKVVIDTETTGFDKEKDEILQLSIVDADTGEVLFNEYFKPETHTCWPEAEAVNHISPEMVADRPHFSQRAPSIREIFDKVGLIVGYNTSFDTDFLEANGIPCGNIPKVDVMRDFAEFYGEYDQEHGRYKWKKLTFCAEYFHFDWTQYPPHNSLGDVFATLHCWHGIEAEKATKV